MKAEIIIFSLFFTFHLSLCQWPSSFPPLQVLNSASLSKLPVGLLQFVQFSDPISSEFSSFSYLNPQADPYIIRLPNSINSSNSISLLAYIWAGNAGTLCNGFESILDKYNVIYVAPQNAGNFINDTTKNPGRYTEDREEKTIWAIRLIATAFNIDPSLIAVGGLSGGGRVASDLAYDHPELLSRVLGDSGCDSYKEVGNGDAYAYDWTGTTVDVIRDQLRIAITTGPSDFRNINLGNVYYKGFLPDNVTGLFSNKSGQGHSCPPAATLDEVYDFFNKNVRKCNYPCQDCNPATKNICSACYSGYVFNGKCVGSCPGGYGVMTVNAVKVCQKCTFVGCTSCYLKDGSCQASCGNNYYSYLSGSDKVCGKCIAYCATCSDAKSCSACITGYKILNGKCVRK